MSDYIFIRRSRNILSSVLHVIFNIALGVGSVVITNLTGSWVLGILLVLLSKWRMLAVRPRYWFVNIKSNLVDLIVGISFVLIAYCSGSTFMPVHTLLAIAYSLWLVVLKPRSTERSTELQALVAIFLGTTSSTMMFASSDSIFLLISCFIIGYGASRHVLMQSDDEDYGLIPLVAGLLAAEIAWLCHSWLIVYSFHSFGLIIPQLSIILSVLAFLANYTYKSIVRHDGELELSEVIMPAIFSILLLSVVIIWFSEPIFNV